MTRPYWWLKNQDATNAGCSRRIVLGFFFTCISFFTLISILKIVRQNIAAQSIHLYALGKIAFCIVRLKSNVKLHEANYTVRIKFVISL